MPLLFDPLNFNIHCSALLCVQHCFSITFYRVNIVPSVLWHQQRNAANARCLQCSRNNTCLFRTICENADRILLLSGSKYNQCIWRSRNDAHSLRGAGGTHESFAFAFEQVRPGILCWASFFYFNRQWWSHFNFPPIQGRPNDLIMTVLAVNVLSYQSKCFNYLTDRNNIFSALCSSAPR